MHLIWCIEISLSIAWTRLPPSGEANEYRGLRHSHLLGEKVLRSCILTQHRLSP